MDIIELLFEANTEQLENAEKSVESLKEKVMDLTGEIPGLGAVFKGLSTGVDEAAKFLGGFENKLASVTVGAELAVVALGALGVGLAFKYNEVVDELGDLGDKYGYTASQIELMKSQVEGVGGSLSAVMQIFDQAATAAYRAKDPLKGTGAAFDELGINVKDASGELKSTNEIVEETVAKWKDGSQSTADLAAAQKILGSGFLENLPALEAMLDAQKRANDFIADGIGITESATKASEDSKAANQDLTYIMTAMGSKLVEDIIPYFTDLTKQFVQSYKEGGLVAYAFDGIRWSADALLTVLAGVIDVIQVLWSGLKLLGTAVVDVGNTIGGLGAAFVALLHGDLAGAKDVMHDIGQQWNKDMSASFQDMMTTATHGWEGIKKIWDTNDQVAAPKTGNFTHGGGDTAPAKAGTDPNKAILSLIDSLKQQTDVLDHLNVAQQINNKLKEDQYNNADGQLKLEAQDLAQKKDLAETNNILANGTKALSASTDAYVQSIQKQISPLQQSKEAIDHENAVNKLKADYIKTINDLLDKGLATSDAVAQAAANMTNALDAENAAYAQQQAYMADWVGRGADAYIKSIGNVNDALTKTVESGLSDFETHLDDLMTTGKFGFRDFATSIVQDLMKMIVQFTIMIPLANTLKTALAGSGGSGGGSFLSTAMSAASSWLGGLADGGPAAPGQTYLVGEKGPELMTVGPNGGYITPNSKLNTGSSGSGVVINTPVTVTMTSSSNATDNANLARQLQQTIDATVTQVLRREGRAGGMLNPVRN